METCLLILLYIISFFQASGDRQKSSNLDCLYDSFETVICTWIPVKNAMKGQCQLTASVDYGKPPKTCQMNGTSIRSCKLILEDYSLAIIDPLFLVVSCNIGKKWTEVHSQTIEPFKSIQLQPPCNLQLENASKPSYNLTWTLCVVSHYLKEKLEYEIRYRANSSGETETILPIAQDQKWVIIENLSPDTVFEAAIRVKIKQISYYNSIWSRWSTPPLRWRTDPEVIFGASPQTTFFPVIVAIAGSFIISIFIIFLIVSPASKRFRKMLKINLPDPAEFFPSLTGIHGGDIQKWLSSPAFITSFNITAEPPNVSILEIMQNSSKESCLLPPKEYFTNIENTAEISGESSSSCFMNRGYFFFHHLDSLEIDSCKVYFTYDAATRSEDSDFYFHKELHEASHNFPSSTNIMTNQENGAFIQDYSRDNFPSGGNFPIASTVEQNENMEDRIPLVLSSNSSEQYSIDDLSKPQSSSHNTDGIELLRNEDLSNNVMRNNRFMFSNQGQSNDFCRAASSSQISSSSEAYLSLRDFQRHYSYHSV